MKKWIKILGAGAAVVLALGAAILAWQKLGEDTQEDLEEDLDGER